MGIEIDGQVERVNGKELSYSEFAEQYMAKNRPVVLTGLMDDWRACTDWVTENGKPNLSFFFTNFGRSKVQVWNVFRILLFHCSKLNLTVKQSVLWSQYCY